MVLNSGYLGYGRGWLGCPGSLEFRVLGFRASRGLGPRAQGQDRNLIQVPSLSTDATLKPMIPEHSCFGFSRD